MATAIREQILEALLNKAQSLADNTVQRCVRSQYEGAGLFITLWDGEEVSELNDYQEQVYMFPVLFEIQTAVLDENPSTLANSIVANVINTVLDHDPNLYDLTENLHYAGFTPIYPDDGGLYLGLTVTFNIEYKTVYGNYTQQP